MASIFWNNDFSGSVNQATAPQLLATNQFKNLVNATQDEVGAVGRRTGSALFLNQIGSGGAGIQGLHMYQKNDGNNYLHMVTGGDLYIADESAGVWDLQDSTFVLNNNLDVDFANFLNRHYFIGRGGTLGYVTDTGTATTVAGNIEGDFLAVNGAYLAVANVAEGIVRWSGVGADTFADEDFINIGNKITGLASFGSGRPFIVFTEDTYTIVDPVRQTSDEVNIGIGAVSHKSIANVRGRLVFLSREGFYSLTINQAFPEEISRVVRNDWDEEAYFNRLQPSQVLNVSAVGLKDKYLCAVRNFNGNIEGAQGINMVLEFDLAQQNVKAHSFPTSVASHMAKYIDSNGELNIYAGTYGTQSVMKLFVKETYTDEDETGAEENVETVVITKDFAFANKADMAIQEQNIRNLHFNYYAEEDLIVELSADGGEYESFITLERTNTTLESWKWVDSAWGTDCKTVSVRIRGSGKWMLYGIGFEIESTETPALTLV